MNQLSFINHKQQEHKLNYCNHFDIQSPMQMNRFLRRRKSIQEFNQQQPFDHEKQSNVIEQTRRAVMKMNEQQRFKKAKRHLEDALAYRTPRPDTYNQNLSFIFKKVYQIQSSKAWGWLLFIIGYMYMYLVVLDSPNVKALKLVLQITFLTIFWVDAVMELYHTTRSPNPLIAKLPKIFYGKIIILILLTLDMFIYWISLTFYNPSRPIRIFRIFRATIPLFYDNFIRKSFQALISCYKDIVVYLMFYTMVIVGFAIVGNQIIVMPPGTQFDNYKQNYIDLQKIIFVIYVMSSYDAYPDNQIIAVRASIYNYVFFIVFVFFNVFFFVVIPATIIFNSFRETRSRIMLVDQIKQKHSLILSFVSLGQDNLNISHQKLIKFLLYIYKGKIRYIDHITQVCLKLDRYNNGFIQVNQYMQLCKVLQQNSSVMPPNFHDIQIWIELRKYMNERFKLYKLVSSDGFRVLNTLFILATFLNCCLYLATGQYTFALLDNMFMGIFILQVTVKMVGLGVQNYFEDKWNTLDFGLILTGLIIQIIPKEYQPHNSDVLFKMTRIFRVTTLLKIIFRVKTVQKHNSIFRKIRQLLGQMTIIVPIILKFFPLFMITYYVLGIIGMQAYYGEANIKAQNSPYSYYNEFSNFKSFMATQFIMVQVLVQAGWSLVAFDHAYRFGHYLLTMLYFVGIHMITVLMLSALMKGLVWQVYFTVNQEYQERLRDQQAYDLEQQKLKKMRQEVEAIKLQVQGSIQLTPDTIIKKQLVENRLDLQIIANIKSNYLERIRSKKQLLLKSQEEPEKNIVIKQAVQSNQLIQAGRVSRKGVVSHIIKDRKIKLQELNLSGLGQSKSSLHAIIQRDYVDYLIDDANPISESSLDDQMEKILTNIILNPNIAYSQTIIYPAQFMEYLNTKLRDPMQIFSPYQNYSLNKIDEDQNSCSFIEYQMNILLGIERSKREQQSLILKSMLDEGTLKQSELSDLVKNRKYIRSKDEALQVDWVMRRTFLGDANEDQVKKFEIEYFSEVYGKSFREINKVTLQPLIKFEATLTYCLRNLLRIPSSSQLQFFTLLTTIQDSISSKLLKKGSIFKFVFELDPKYGTGQNWFCIQFKRDTKQIKIHFIKSGIWLSEHNFGANQIKYASDIFNWQHMSVDQKERSAAQKFIKKFYQSFESIAFGLNSKKDFFEIDPTQFVYDLYAFYLTTGQVQRKRRMSEDDVNIRIGNQRIPISKIMAVALSREQQRDKKDYLKYKLSDLTNQRKQRSGLNSIFKHKFNESEEQTFQKLKQFSVIDEQKIIKNEGIPFSFIVNLMTEVKDILTLYPQSIKKNVQQVFNMCYQGVNIESQDNQKLQELQIEIQEAK